MRTVLILATLLVLPIAAAEDPPAVHSQSAVMTHPLRGDVVPVDGAEAHLVRSPAGITAVFAARDLIPGNVYTVWLIVVDNPSACAATPCTAPEVMGSSDLVAANVTFGDGLVAPADGTATFVAHLAPGPIEDGWFDADFTDPLGAEVHLGLHNHGPLIESLADEMLTSYRAGCTDDSLPPGPPTASADGTPGPNDCRMWQFAIFVPPVDAAP